MQVPIAVLMRGASHISGDLPVTDFKLKTAEGLKFYNKKVKLMRVARESGSIDRYIEFVRSEFLQFQKEMSDFINDPVLARKYKMDENDPYGWAIYYELLDKYNVCKHFLDNKK